MAGPPGRRLRLSDIDRERLTGSLREHFALGRLDPTELDRRLGVVLGAEYADQAAAAFDDLPPLARREQPGSGRPDSGRHAQSVSADPAWQPTQERFRDPTTGTVIRVWIDPADGARHYVPDV